MKIFVLIFALGTSPMNALAAAVEKEELKSMNWETSRIKAHLVRLRPNQDLTSELKLWAKTRGIHAASILSAVGSLKKVTLRFANQPKAETKEGHFEITSLTGMLDSETMHIHASVSLPSGETIGGHLMGENIIYTTIELSIAEYQDVRFTREKDDTFGYQELRIQKSSKESKKATPI